MQKMIMIPEERYNCMLESYDKAVEELYDLQDQLQAIKESNPRPQMPQGDFVISEAMMKHAKSDEAITLRLIRSRLHSREESIARSQQSKEGGTDED